MGDGDEIKNLIRKESESFLKRALFQARGTEGAYDFDAEFAKTRHHKSRVVFGLTAATILGLAILALAVTRAIGIRTAATPVSVSAFEDLNLRDILDSSKQDESSLERAKSQLASLGADLNSGLEFADRDYRASVQSIDAQNLTPDEEANRVAIAASTRDARKLSLQSDYALSATESRAKIAAVQKRIDRYDTRSLARAKDAEAVLENERLASDLERNQYVRLYDSRIGAIEAANVRDLAALARQRDELAAALTARYNPTLSDSRSASLLESRVDIPSSAPAPFDPYLGQAGILDLRSQARLDASLSDLEYLLFKLRAIPYLNSVHPALSRIDDEARSSIGAYREALRAAGEGLSARDKEITSLDARAKAAEDRLEMYRVAVEEYMKDSHQNGYVLDARDPAKLLVVLDTSLGIQEGERGYLVRNNVVIATVAFSLEGGGTFAAVVSMGTGLAPRALDKILVVRPESNK